jgi:hypothetical protein
LAKKFNSFWSGKTVKHCTRIGNANVLITVIFPKRDIFLRDQSFKSFLIFSNFE